MAQSAWTARAGDSSRAATAPWFALIFRAQLHRGRADHQWSPSWRVAHSNVRRAETLGLATSTLSPHPQGEGAISGAAPHAAGEESSLAKA
jgi:hypothetical protein